MGRETAADKISARSESSRPVGEPMGIYFRSIKRYHLLSAEEEREVARRAAAGDYAARDCLIVSNLRLVVKIAHGYLSRGVPLSDLVGEGNLGLIHAVSKFNPELGHRFTTYAIWWIREAIEKYLMDNSHFIRLPPHILRELSVILRTRAAIAREGLEDDLVQELTTRLNQDPQRVVRLLRLHEQPLSLDFTIFDGASERAVSLQDVIPGSVEDNPSRQVLRHEIIRLLREWFNGLNYEHQVVVLHRFGIADDKIESLRDVGGRINLSRERVRKIQNEALETLRRRLDGSGITPADLSS